MINIVPIVSRRKNAGRRGTFAPSHAQSLNAAVGVTLCGRNIVDPEMLEVGFRIDCGECARKLRRQKAVAA